MGSFKHEFMLKNLGLTHAEVNGNITQSIYLLPGYEYYGYYLPYSAVVTEKEDEDSLSKEMVRECGQVKFKVDLRRQFTKVAEVYRFPTDKTFEVEKIREFEKQLLETLTDQEKLERPKLVYCSFETESETTNKHTESWISDIPVDLYVDGGVLFDKNEKFKKALLTKVQNDYGKPIESEVEDVLSAFAGCRPIFCFKNSDNFPTKGFFITCTSRMGDVVKDLNKNRDKRNDFIDMERFETAVKVVTEKALNEGFSKDDICMWGIQFGWKEIEEKGDKSLNLLPAKFVFTPVRVAQYKDKVPNFEEFLKNIFEK